MIDIGKLNSLSGYYLIVKNSCTVPVLSPVLRNTYCTSESHFDNGNSLVELLQIKR